MLGRGSRACGRDNVQRLQYRWHHVEVSVVIILIATKAANGGLLTPFDDPACGGPTAENTQLTYVLEIPSIFVFVVCGLSGNSFEVPKLKNCTK